MSDTWKPIATCPQGKLVMTKIHPAGEESRNEQPLTKDGNLFWVSDGSMYVYYTPTHWKDAS